MGQFFSLCPARPRRELQSGACTPRAPFGERAGAQTEDLRYSWTVDSRAIGLGVVEGVDIWNSSWLTNKDLETTI